MDDFAGDAGAEEARKWISATEAAAMLQMGKSHLLKTAKERGYTRRQAHSRALTYYLRKEIESWADFRQLRRQWLKKYPGARGGKRYTEELDAETAQRLFINSDEAAALLGVTRKTVHVMVRAGRLISYQSVPGHSGARLWFRVGRFCRWRKTPNA